MSALAVLCAIKSRFHLVGMLLNVRQDVKSALHRLISHNSSHQSSV